MKMKIKYVIRLLIAIAIVDLSHQQDDGGKERQDLQKLKEKALRESALAEESEDDGNLLKDLMNAAAQDGEDDGVEMEQAKEQDLGSLRYNDEIKTEAAQDSVKEQACTWRYYYNRMRMYRSRYYNYRRAFFHQKRLKRKYIHLYRMYKRSAYNCIHHLSSRG